MKGRWMIPAVLALMVGDALVGLVAYGSSTWNWDRTEVLRHWDAVRFVCLVLYPTFMGATALIAGLIWLAVRWRE